VAGASVEILVLPSQGKSVDEICRTHNISTATFYNWRNKYGGMDTEELRKLKALQAENARLKKLLADKSLDRSGDPVRYSQRCLRVTKKALSPTTPQTLQMVRTVVEQQQASLRRVCRVVGQRRATVYAKPKRVSADQLIGEQLMALSVKYLNWGFALMFGWLRLAGHQWNHKRVYRVYKSMKLNLRAPVKRKKIKRDNPNTLAASKVGQGWSLDFLSDEVVAEKKTRILNVLDEYSGTGRPA